LKGFDEKIFNEFNKKSEDLNLFEKIKELKDGKKVNLTENKSARHMQQREEYSVPNFELETFEDIQDLQTLMALADIKNIIVIGIGGSYEGPKLILEALRGPDLNYRIEFITGSDPEEFRYKTYNLKPEETCFFISSKSFTTDETIENLKTAINWSKDLGNFIAITSNRTEAEKYGIKNIFEFNNDIGGRYSIWSIISQPVFAGTSSFFSFNEGGYIADKDLLENDKYLEFIKYLSFSDIYFNNQLNKNSRVVLSYNWRLRSFADYIQQLEMESLGKIPFKDSEFQKTGQVIFGGYGPIAQHSFFQLMHQGTQELCADIIAVKDNSLAYAQAITQSKLLSEGADDLKEIEKINGNIPTNLFILNELNPTTLGYLIATWEHRVYVTSVMLQINAFDQFGVNAGKIYTKKYLADKD
jgi:glucose-6-phosphate isomerase